ncbi:MAG: hypothetical protein ACREJM_11280, partial [Candidatus Saccharimonadales bacterium]
TQFHMQTAGHPLATEIGELAGSAADPLYYIPYLDLVARPLKLAALAALAPKIGELGAGIVTGAGEQALNATLATAAEQPLQYVAAQVRGEPYTWQQGATQIGLAALYGGAAGALFWRVKLTPQQRIAGIVDATDAISEGRPADAATATGLSPSGEPDPRYVGEPGLAPKPIQVDERLVPDRRSEGETYYAGIERRIGPPRRIISTDEAALDNLGTTRGVPNTAFTRLVGRLVNKKPVPDSPASADWAPVGGVSKNEPEQFEMPLQTISPKAAAEPSTPGKPTPEGAQIQDFGLSPKWAAHAKMLTDEANHQAAYADALRQAYECRTG